MKPPTSTLPRVSILNARCFPIQMTVPDHVHCRRLDMTVPPPPPHTVLRRGSQSMSLRRAVYALPARTRG